MADMILASVRENPNRLTVLTDPVLGILRQNPLGDNLHWVEDGDVVKEELLFKVHDPAHLEKMAKASSALEPRGPYSVATIDSGDTVVSSGSWNAALRAAGAAVKAVDLVLSSNGDVRNAFCAVRPPGHHMAAKGGVNVLLRDDPQGSQGFCLLNNVMLAAVHAQDQHNVKKVAILDFDVHHGNGTQALMNSVNREGLWFGSMHGYERGFYPGSGAAKNGGGNVVNVPISLGTVSHSWRQAAEKLLEELREFGPEC